MRNKILLGLGVASLIFGALFFLLNEEPQDVKAGTITRKVDVIGTGTSTAGTTNYNAAATSTGTFIVGPGTDTVDLVFYHESASSTSHVNVQVLASTLDRCAVSDAVDANSDWVDAISNNSVSGNVTTLNSATSSVSWIPTTASYGKIYRLTNVNANCFKVEVGGKSVNLYVQAVLKTLSF